ncbi:hypothetical protein ACH5RR_001667 [Cinchona calisaya]|uniref:Uncharacterized protein n=1 Tax=Cinchona calisaya TaxID=153742 RepID=A0ABD3B4H0_9GENT
MPREIKTVSQRNGVANRSLPLEDNLECGIVKNSGFIWLKQKQKTMHKFDKIGKTDYYAAEITAYVEPKKLKRLESRLRSFSFGSWSMSFSQDRTQRKS